MLKPLKDYFRWLERDGKIILQVLQAVFIPEGSTGQGHYEETWTDVPVVKEDEQKLDGVKLE